MKELKDVAKKAAQITFGRIIGQFLDLLTVLVITYFIGGSIYGSYLYIFSLINFIPVLANLGMSNGLLAVIPKYFVSGETIKRNSVITFSILACLSLSIIFVTVIFLLNNKIALFLFKNDFNSRLILISLAPLGIIMSLNNIMQYALRGLGGVKYFILSTEIIMPIIKIITLLLLILFSYKMTALIISTYTSFLVVFIYLFLGILKFKLLAPIKLIYLNEYKQLLKFSLPLMLSSTIGIIITQIDTIMIGFFMTPNNVTVYKIVSQISSITAMILSSFKIAYAPKISELYHKGNIKEIENLYKSTTRWVTAFGLIIFGFIVVNSQLIIKTLFGNQYLFGSNALIILSLGQLVNSATGSVSQINIMTGNSTQQFYSQVFNMFLKVALNFILIEKFGINGAAFSAMICLSLVNLLRTLIVYRNLKMHPFEISMLKSIISMTIGILAIYYLNTIITLQGFIHLIVNGIIYIIIFVLFLIIFGISNEDKILLNTLISKFNRKQY